MPEPYVILVIFFFYGLAFFSMGVAIIMELAHCTDARLKRALRPLAAFGLIHGMHEWSEMNAVYVTYFPDHLPARSAFGTTGLALGARVEIECVATIK